MNASSSLPIIYRNDKFGQLRVVGDRIIAQDAAAALGYSNTRDAVARHVDEVDKADVVIHDGSQRRVMVGINESGLYALIFGSALPGAKEFKRWVTSEVLPEIRQHGLYATPEVVEKSLQDPDFIIGILTKVKEQRAELAAKEKYIAVMEPKAEFYDAVAGSRDAIAIGDVAKVLAIRGLGQNNLFKRLRELHILDKSNIPMQEYVDRGYFRVIEQKYTVPSGETRISLKTLVFQRGLDYIRKIVTPCEA